MARRRHSAEKIEGGFAPITWKMLNSKAYKELKFSSAKALPYFIGKGRNKMRNDRVYFEFSFTEAKRHGFALATFSSVISDLINKGFIEPIDKGGLRGFKKTSSKFALSDRWEKYGELDFIEINWAQFQPILGGKITTEDGYI